MTNSRLITVFNGTIQNTLIQLCNARELHTFVESKREYATWIKERIADYGFQQDEDYIIVTERTNGRPRKEYHITLDMGKELGMVERNEKGRIIRKHFIEIEKRTNQPQQVALPEPEKTYNIALTENDISNLLWVWDSAERMRFTLYQLNKPLRQLGATLSPEVHDGIEEYRGTIERAKKVLLKLSKDLKSDPWANRSLAKILPRIRNHKQDF